MMPLYREFYEHQRKVLLDDPHRTGLWFGTGTGKTRTALMLAKGNTLIIMPKTQFEDGNWQREATKLFQGPLRYESKYIPGEITEMTFDIFKRDAHKLKKFDTIIVDECHGMLGLTPNTCQRNKVKIPKASQRFEALDEYITRTKPERVYLCTATIMKSPMTVLAAKWILKGATAIHPYSNAMGEFYAFRDEFYTQLYIPNREVWAPRNDSATKDKLAAMVKDLGYTGRLQDFFDVPDQTFKTEYVELTERQRERIKELPMEYPDALVRIGKIHQVENGVLKGDEFSRGELFSNGKIDRVIELAGEFPRLVVFAKYTDQIMALTLALTDAYPNKTVYNLTGNTQNRGQVIAEANANEDAVVIAQAQVSAGWELPEYPVMVFASRTGSFVDYDQAIGRIHRANALKKNLYITLISRPEFSGSGKNKVRIGGVDKGVDQALANKQDFNERIYVDNSLA